MLFFGTTVFCLRPKLQAHTGTDFMILKNFAGKFSKKIGVFDKTKLNYAKF
jgi:hypothetical protein